MTRSVDIAVIGSGFGAGPAALRSAQAGATVAVIEEGQRYDTRPGAVAFQQTQSDLNYLLELWRLSLGFDWTSSTASLAITARGLGGGSLIYSMVSLRAPSFVFDDPVWPAEIDRAELDPYYSRAEEQLGVVQVSWTGNRPDDDWKMASKRDAAFAIACEQADMSCDPVPVAVNQNCGNLGWCSTGCVRHGKSSVDLQYLQTAEDLGAVMVLGTRVETIEPAGLAAGRRWRLRTVRTADQGADEILADTVVVAGGAIGSPVVLQQSAGTLGHGISPQCGRNLSRGGDLMIPVVLPEDFESRFGIEMLEQLPGKIIGSCSFQHLFEPPPGFDDSWQPFIIQPMMVLPLLSTIMVADPDGITSDGGDMRAFGLGHKHLMQQWGTRLLHLGIMGVDGMDGTVTAGPAGTGTISFGLAPETKSLFAGARAAAAHMMNSIGGQALPSWDQIRGDSFTIHPLGTCRMAESVDLGVIDHLGRVYRSDGVVYDGLYVMDASTYSSPIAVNTSLTAAAISERATEHLLAAL